MHVFFLYLAIVVGIINGNFLTHNIMYEIKQNTATVEYQPHFFIGQTPDKIPAFLLQQKIPNPYSYFA